VQRRTRARSGNGARRFFMPVMRYIDEEHRIVNEPQDAAEQLLADAIIKCETAKIRDGWSPEEARRRGEPVTEWCADVAAAYCDTRGLEVPES